jgi:hypothetical protein
MTRITISIACEARAQDYALAQKKWTSDDTIDVELEYPTSVSAWDVSAALARALTKLIKQELNDPDRT